MIDIVQNETLSVSDQSETAWTGFYERWYENNNNQSINRSIYYRIEYVTKVLKGIISPYFDH